MVLDSIIPPKGEKFPEELLKAIQEEIVYWNAGPVKVCQTKEASAFPIPVKIYCHDGKKWQDLGKSLISRGLADFGHVDLSNSDYKLHARGINTAAP